MAMAVISTNPYCCSLILLSSPLTYRVFLNASLRRLPHWRYSCSLPNDFWQLFQRESLCALRKRVTLTFGISCLTSVRSVAIVVTAGSEVINGYFTRRPWLIH
jgi:hypothetical protein